MKAADIRFWAWAIILLIAAVFYGAYRDDDGKGYYQHIAEDSAQQCIDNFGRGTGWKASSGIELETFCKTRGYRKALDEQCSGDPRTC